MARALVVFVASILAVCALSAMQQPKRAASAPVRPDLVRQRLQAAFDALRTAYGVPGGTLGIVLADGTSLGLATGVADRSSERAMAPSDRMPVDGVGQTYVAALILQFARERRLALDDRLDRWFQTAEWWNRLPGGHSVTVRMLLSHTSGLGRYVTDGRFLADLAARPDREWQPNELLNYVLDTRPEVSAGKLWTYAETNYLLLGMIIEQIAGEPYSEVLAKRLLEPFKLKDTLPLESLAAAGVVQGYAGPASPLGGADAMVADGRLSVNPRVEWPAGTVASTAQDLARWTRVLFEGRVFGQALLAEMLKGVPAGPGAGVRYGLGVIVRQTSLGVSYGHSGSFPGYLTEIAYFPRINVSIALQVNASVLDAAAKPLWQALVDLAQLAAGS